MSIYHKYVFDCTVVPFTYNVSIQCNSIPNTKKTLVFNIKGIAASRVYQNFIKCSKPNIVWYHVDVYVISIYSYEKLLHADPYDSWSVGEGHVNILKMVDTSR